VTMSQIADKTGIGRATLSSTFQTSSDPGRLAPTSRHGQLNISPNYVTAATLGDRLEAVARAYALH